VYGQEGGAEISDESQTCGESFSSRRILEAEGALLNHDQSAIVVRASGIYGPGRIATISRLAHTDLEAVERELWTNRIHRDDLARDLVFLLESPDARGIYLATDPNPATLGEIQDWLRERPQRTRLPAPRADGPTRSRKSRRMYPNRLLSAGFSFVYLTFRDGYAPLLEQL
jgi:nucleoside-diphosphate-sugar epimerase